jgi:exosome complex component CSL4
MTNKRIKDGDHVLPGVRLGVIEEFIPGEGTYQDKDDAIYATITGYVRIDMKERKISVEAKTRTPIYPRKNDIVLGEIQNVSKKSAVVNIFKIGNEECPIHFTGFLYINNAASGYIDQMRDLYCPSDLIIARVQQTSDGMARLSTVGSRFGVFRASCSRCGEPLHQQGKQLECSECGNIERRKIAKAYGEILTQELTEDEAN